MQPKLASQIEEFSHLVILMERELNRLDPCRLSNSDLTVGQFFAGRILSQRNLLTMSELAQEMNISLPTLTGIIDRMVKNGFIQRERVESDRRLVKVRLTQSGKRIINEFEKQKQNRFQHMLTAFNQQDRQVFLRLMRKLVEGLSEN